MQHYFTGRYYADAERYTNEKEGEGWKAVYSLPGQKLMTAIGYDNTPIWFETYQAARLWAVDYVLHILNQHHLPATNEAAHLLQKAAALIEAQPQSQRLAPLTLLASIARVVATLTGFRLARKLAPLNPQKSIDWWGLRRAQEATMTADAMSLGWDAGKSRKAAEEYSRLAASYKQAWNEEANYQQQPADVCDHYELEGLRQAAAECAA